jgi:hypothetical protein
MYLLTIACACTNLIQIYVLILFWYIYAIQFIYTWFKIKIEMCSYSYGVVYMISTCVSYSLDKHIYAHMYFGSHRYCISNGGNWRGKGGAKGYKRLFAPLSFYMELHISIKGLVWSKIKSWGTILTYMKI